MTEFRYVGDEPRIFPHVSLEVAPGDVVALDSNPDPRWFTEAKPSKPAPTPED